MDQTQQLVHLDGYPFLKIITDLFKVSYLYVVSYVALGEISIRQTCITKHVSTWSDKSESLIGPTDFKNWKKSAIERGRTPTNLGRQMLDKRMEFLFHQAHIYNRCLWRLPWNAAQKLQCPSRDNFWRRTQLRLTLRSLQWIFWFQTCREHLALETVHIDAWSVSPKLHNLLEFHSFEDIKSMYLL